MPQSHGTRRKPRRGHPPAARTEPAPDAYGDRPYGEERYAGLPAEPRKSGVRRVFGVLTHNVTIAVVGIAVIGAGLTFLDPGKLPGAGSKPPKMAASGMSANDMLAKLTHTGDMDPIAANAVASAKENAYKAEQKRIAALKAKAKADARARAKLKALEAKRKAEEERKKLAASNPSAQQNKAYGRKMSALKGWGGCWSSLETLWDHESGWNERAENPGSGAYGIPQALPGSKLASAGPDWRTSSPTQIAWGLGYIKARYHDPCGAWAWWSSHHWY
ncbi:lytic transglycosylase domain-containing protein [Actinomadura parmotrematis]|uniref:Lytic transglycosylase domain-containing protein n=1 Tax=Actinomadura parmotrematis TaxID=2864039 RepID=A0ABS7G1X8_9ACTN|nr:lytic transglycosylase domain-containing protein [Actinomadura parmotrematis]MBW8486677.1 lytic transglycosylase domain-containing protein [Actinomadura parmotrematis]